MPVPRHAAVPSVEALKVRTKAWERAANRRCVRIRLAFSVRNARRTFHGLRSRKNQPVARLVMDGEIHFGLWRSAAAFVAFRAGVFS